MLAEKTRLAVIQAGIAIINAGLVEGTWGNISARTPDGEWLAITPSGRSYSTLQPSDIVILDLQGQVKDGKYEPSSELPLHLAIYQRRRETMAVVHTHSPYATTCAVTRRRIPPIVEDMAQVVGGAVDVASYALPGTADLAEKAVQALGEKYAVLLANHGLIGIGQTLAEAVTVCKLVEKAAKMFIWAHLLGGPCILAKEDVSFLHEQYLKHYRLKQWAKEDEHGQTTDSQRGGADAV